MRMVWVTRAAALAMAVAMLPVAPGDARAQKRYFAISPMAMNVDGQNEDVSYTMSFSGGFLKVNDDAVGSRCFVTGVPLPDGAWLKRFRVWAVGKTNAGVLINIYATKLGFGEGSTLFNGVRGDESGQRVEIVAPINGGPAISLKTSYSFSICLDPGESFHGARLDYAVDFAN